MNFLPRLREACNSAMKGSAPGEATPPLIDLTLPNPAEEANVALLTGTIVEEPLRDKGRDGSPVTVLLVSLDAPDERSRRAVAVCEIEVPNEIADEQRRRLRRGRRLVVLGHLTGAGGLWASAIATGAAAPPGERSAEAPSPS